MKIKNKIKTSNEIRLERSRRALAALAMQQATEYAARLRKEPTGAVRKPVQGK